LADKLIGIGCYDEAVHILEDGSKLFPSDRSLQARLRTARSFVGEREYLDKQVDGTAAMTDAAFLRLQLRCKQIGDLQACDQALTAKPGDAAIWAAKGDALLKEKRSREALVAFNRAKQVAQGTDIDVTSRVNAALALLVAQNPPAIAPVSKPATVAVAQTPIRTAAVTPPAPRFSNIEPVTRSN
jgi:tetratricopeptide (TPR) repeat protein